MASIPESLDNAAVVSTKPEPKPIINPITTHENLTNESPENKYGVSTSKLRSLKDITRNKLEQQKEKTKTEITVENLIDAWKVIYEKLTQNKMLYRNAVAESSIGFHEDTITIASQLVAIEYLRTERSTLLQYFKQHYNNEKINVLFDILPEKKESHSNTFRGAKERYEDMVQKNPYLKKLRDSLGFDLEY